MGRPRRPEWGRGPSEAPGPGFPASDRLVECAGAAGVFTYLLKPVNQRDLHAAIQMARARFAELQALREQVRDPTEDLEIQKVVEQARGMLMKRLQLSEGEAYRWLQRRAFAEGRSLREISGRVHEADRFHHELDTDES